MRCRAVLICYNDVQSYKKSRHATLRLQNNFIYLQSRHGSSVMARRVGVRVIVRIGLKQKKSIMKTYVCDVCGWEYDPEVGDPKHGIAPGTAFEDLPDDWVCPLCGVGKDEFSPA